ncbi:4,5-dihydroxyphthalate dehydrogenase [Niastella yeongjuensis]|uniref:4,5-dihydroxyphthalate dehydrogenase n=1 Tax=Niastella yeongjuensis TaxID=354355 RepID=A0A1V9DXY2_9BACT|nr:Gfo/Idh/MocA family oxidoreductase [Niastella yeongjuensis]OQP38659.1 4,5-dihydroxyphthalate dehydrogenase [Niastella yeongjuensis]SEO37694.1 Oxidoreductase family, C-terminal alpha/beta domain [Niastella yeongjuensis]
MDRKKFIQQTTGAAASALLIPGALKAAFTPTIKPMRVAMIGTGHRGTGMWGEPVVAEFPEHVKFVGLCDINKGRVEYAKQALRVDCPTYTDFDAMMKETKPDTLIVTTVDGTHNEFIVKGMEYGANIITEKPMTTDEMKCQQILDAEKRTGKKVRVTFNYRYSPHRVKIYELLRAGAVGDIKSVDFHWYLDTSHGADYFRRWHRLRKNSGSLLVHKASHHFDLLNWWIDSDPKQVFAYGNLDVYGKNGPFRHTHCRPCPHKSKCNFYFDLTANKRLMNIYAANEQYDGYMRDGCVFKEDIDIFDKMAVQIMYSNQVQVSYSLTAYSPYEGYRISFNGTKGKLDAWIKEKQPWEEEAFDEIQLTHTFGKREVFRIPNNEDGHGGGDVRLRKQIFMNESDPLHQSAGSRDGSLACLVGIAARNSIDTGKPIDIASLTTLVPQAQKVANTL